ncbi:MAG TPA: MFS transporter [Natronosporangium sp.]
MHEQASATRIAPVTRTDRLNRTDRWPVALLVAATATGSLGLAAGGTAGALLAVAITGREATAGLPIGVLVAGSAVGALAISRAARRLGRGRALAAGYAIGAAGALLVAVAAGRDSLLGVLAGSFVMGVANPAVFLARYAAADLTVVRARGRAIGAVLAGATVGAVAGPNLLGPSGRFAAGLGLPDLAGLYLVAVGSFGLAAAMLVGLPAVRTAGPQPVAAARSADRPAAAALGALGLLAAANLVMVGIMAIAPPHLTAHGHDLTTVGVIVSLHVVGMFALSPGFGWLADRLGGAVVGGLGIGLLALVGVATIAVDPADRTSVTVYLVLLGVGWSGAVVGGSALLVAELPPAVRPRGEAWGEVAMGLGAAGGAPAAAVVLAAGGLSAVGLAAAGVAVAALAAAALARGHHADRPRRLADRGLVRRD